MITVELNQKDIISLIRGTCPSYEQISKFEELGLGTYTGGFADRWDWISSGDIRWDCFTEIQLYDMYLSLKD